MKGSMNGMILFVYLSVIHITTFISIGLVQYLRANYPALYRLLEHIKSRPNRRPTNREVQIANGKIPLTSPEAIEYLKQLGGAIEGSLPGVFARQMSMADVSLFRFLFTCSCPNRNHGMKKYTCAFSRNGSSHVINLSKRLRDRNFRRS